MFEQAIWQEAMMAAEEVLFQEVPPEARPNGRRLSETQIIDQLSECESLQEPSDVRKQTLDTDAFAFSLSQNSPGGYEGSLENSEKYDDTMEQFSVREDSYRNNVRFVEDANSVSFELEHEPSKNAVKRQSKISVIAPSDAMSDHPKDT